MAKKSDRHEDERRADDTRTGADAAHRDDEESGTPGGGQGRRDAVGRSRVYPASASERPGPDAALRTENAWGQGERGAAGYEDAGTSELASSEEIRRGIEQDRRSAGEGSGEEQRSGDDQRSDEDQRSGEGERSSEGER